MAAQSPLPPLRRRRHDHVAQALRLGALTLALLAGPAAGQAAAATRILLHLPGGDRTLSDTDLDDKDVLDEDYVLRGPGSEHTDPLSGLSVGHMLAKVDYEPNEGFLHLDRTDGTWATLSAADMGDPSPFQFGRKPIVFVDGEDSERTRFFRPVRDGTDENADDNILADGEPLEIWLETGALLKVTATASKDSAAKGEAVTFTASVSGQHAGETLSVDWRFDDGETAPGNRVDHRFTQDGVYGVVAQVHGSDDSGGASQVLPVRVGSPSSTDGPGTGGGTNTGPAPATGPSRGPSTGTGGARRNRRAGNPGSGDTGDRPGAKTPKPGATAAPAPAATIGPTSPAPSSTAPQTTTTTPGSGAPPLPETKPRATPTAPEDGELVRGVLVSASAPLSTPPAAAPVRAGARAAAQAGVAAAPLSLTGVAVLLLLAGGAWRETSGRRRRKGA